MIAVVTGDVGMYADVGIKADVGIGTEVSCSARRQQGMVVLMLLAGVLSHVQAEPVHDMRGGTSCHGLDGHIEFNPFGKRRVRPRKNGAATISKHEVGRVALAIDEDVVQKEVDQAAGAGCEGAEGEFHVGSNGNVAVEVGVQHGLGVKVDELDLGDVGDVRAVRGQPVSIRVVVRV